MTPIERRIRWASILIGAGLLIQLGTFVVVHPLAFIAFLVVGCPLVAAGIVLYLVSLLTSTTVEPTRLPGGEPRTTKS